MYKFLTRMLLVALLCMSWVTNAQTHYTVQVGSGTTTNEYVPNYTYYNYAYSQMLYTASEVGIDGVIDTLAFQVNSGSQTRALTIYMAEVSQTNLTTQVPDSLFQQVFAGSVSWSAGWIYIPLDTVFDYQDTGSLVIAVIDSTGSWASSPYYLGMSTTDTRSKYIYSDYDTYTLATQMTNSLQFLPNVQLGLTSNTSYCATPVDVAVTNIDYDSARISWVENGGATMWDLIVSDTIVTDFDAANIISASDTSYLMTGLAANAQYYVYVRANCGTDSYSGWTTVVAFRSSCYDYTIPPYQTGFEDVVSGSLPNCWVAYATGTSGSGQFPSAYNYSTNARTGDVYFEFESTSGQTEIVALPMMEDLNTLQLEFYAACMNTNFTLEAGVIELGENDTTFVVIDTVALTAGAGSNWHNSYFPYVVYFDEYLGMGERIALRVKGVGSYTLMIDDIKVSEIPDCLPPTQFAISNVGVDWVSLSWNDENGSDWEILYDTTTFNPDNNNLTAVTATETSVTLTDLVNGMEYTAYLRSDCGDGYSPWVGPLTFTAGHFSMSFSGSDTVSGCGLTIYDDGGANGEYTVGSNSILVVYPSSEDSLVVFSGSTDIYSYYARLRIYDGVGTNGQLLWQSSSDAQTIPQTSSYSGPITIQFVGGSYNYGYTGFEINTSCALAPQCAMIQNLQAPTVGVGSAYVTWDVAGTNFGVPVGYEVNCIDTTGVTAYTATVTSTNAMISGLTPGTPYVVKVRTDCDNSSYGDYDSISITTASLDCVVIDTDNSNFDTIGTGTTTSNYIPSYSFYNYSLTQQIYKASEIGHGGLITSISVMPAVVNAQRTFEIYLAHTSDSSLSSFIYPTDLTIVYNGDPVTMVANQWLEFQLDQPFNYNGTDNLLVCFRDMTGSYTTANQWYTHTAGYNAACYIYQDGGAYNPYTTTGGTALTSRNNIVISMMECSQLASCAAPVVVVDSVATDAVNLIWGAGYQETSWTVEHKAETDSVWTSDGTTTNTSYTFSNLNGNTRYYFRVGANCTDTTLYTTVNALTKCPADTVPFMCDFENFPSTGYPSCWYSATSYSYGGYPYPYSYYQHGGAYSLYMYSPSGSYTYLVLPELNASIDTLEVSFWMMSTTSTYANELYVGVMTDPENFQTFQTVGVVTVAQPNVWEAVSVRLNTYSGNGSRIAIVSPEGDYVDIYIDDLTVNIIRPCTGVENITLVDVTTDSAVIAWNVTGNTAFDIAYGPAGVALDSATYVTTTIDTVVLGGLTANTQYDVYVRTMCGDEDTSNWSNAFTFRTDCAKITSMPYAEGFENNTPGWSSSYSQDFYPCWYRANNPSSSYYYPYVDSYSAHNGNYGLYWNWDSYDYFEPYVVLPPIDTTVVDISNLQLGFWAMNGSTYNDVPVVYVGTMSNPNAITTFQALDTVAINSTSWTLYEIPLTNYSGNGEYVAVLSGATADYWYAYFDDFSLDNVPTCPHVRDLTVTGNTASTVDLSWTEIGSATTWEVAYDTVATATPVGSITVTGTSSTTVTGLTSGQYYYFWVRSICGDGDTSYWEGPVMAIPNSWFMRANMTDTVTMCGGVLYDDGGPAAAYSASQTSTVIIMPDTTNMLVSVNGSSYTEGSWDYITIYDGAGTDGTVLWTDDGISTLTTFGPFTSSTGPITVVMESDGSVQYDGFEIQINCVSTYCRVTELMLDTAVAPSSSQLALTWNGDGANSYEVEYGTPGFTVGTGTVQTSTTNSIVLSGLNALTQYEVYVRSFCGASDTGSWASAVFQTALCDNVVIAENWDSTMNATTSSYSPIGYSTYNYSYVQTIIDSAYLAEIEDEITAMAFQPASTSAGTHFTHMTVYLANVSESDLTSGFIMPDDSAHVFVPVISDRDMCYSSTEWQLHGFDTTFTWDGHSNILVAVNRQHGTWTSGSSFRAHGASASKMRYAYNDNSAYDPTTVSEGTASSTVGDIRLFSCGAACSKPNGIVATNVDYANATLSWSGNATEYEYAVKAVADATWPVETPVSANTVTLSGMQPATAYQFRVRALCDATEGLISDWAEFTFTTDSLPCFAPTNLALTGNAYTAATFDWTLGTTETMWNVHIWNSSKDTIVEVTAHPATIGGLAMNTQYNAAVSALCGNGAAESDYSETITFTTLNCEPVTNLRVENVTSNSAVVKWNGNAASYDLEYGMSGFQTGNGTRIEGITGTSYTLTGLEDDYHYDVTVMAHCDATTTSSWSDAVDFTTEPVGIATVDGAQVSLYPNPATATTTVTLAGVSGEVTITVVDLNGRTVMSETMSCEGGCTKTLEVSKLLQGAYFVRLSGENVNAVKKLVVK